MKIILPIIVFVSFVSCSKKENPKDQIQYLNGYWEINKVVLNDGKVKLYNYNDVIDFFEIKDSLGIRKKIKPKLNGEYIDTGNQEIFTLKIESDSLRMYYNTPFSQWKETVISAEENQISIMNESGNVYFYRKFEKIKL